MGTITHKGVEIALPDWLAGTAIEDKLRAGEYENKESEAALKRARAGMTILEIGAGLGFVSSVCAGIVGAENVIAVEANPKMLPVIRDTHVRNGVSGVRLVQAAVTADADDRGNAPFRSGKLFWGGALVPEGKIHDDQVDVPLVRISDLLNEYRPRFVIMDVEGGELGLFDSPWPGFVKFVVMEIHPSKYDDEGVARIFAGLMASGFVYDPVTSSGRTVGFKRAPRAVHAAIENAAL